MANIVAIMGSPRRGGNSESLLWAFLSGRKEEDRLEVFIPAEMDIGFCRGCRFCEQMGYCAVHDDMERVLPALLEADKVVVSAPVFFYGFPAHLKALIDRTQPLWVRRYLLKETMKLKDGFLLSVGATKGEKLFDGLVLTARYFFDAFGCAYRGGLFFRGFDARGSIERCAQCLVDVEHSGKSFLQS
ncbi:MAG: flavodoxin family protein [Candidatus Caldatribacteriaceae bacterium]